MPQQERRKHPRYTVRVPVSVRVSNGDSREILVESENVSWDGILLSSKSRMPEGTTVGLVVVIQPATAPQFQLIGKGKVVRVEQQSSAAKFFIAIRCDASFYFPKQA
jgi:hypothetical protein